MARPRAPWLAFSLALVACALGAVAAFALRRPPRTIAQELPHGREQTAAAVDVYVVFQRADCDARLASTRLFDRPEIRAVSSLQVAALLYNGDDAMAPIEETVHEEIGLPYPIVRLDAGLGRTIYALGQRATPFVLAVNRSDGRIAAAPLPTSLSEALSLVRFAAGR